MDLFRIVALLLTLAALFSYVNYRVIRLPTTIGVMLIALVLSLALMALHLLGVHLDQRAAAWVGSVDFSQALLHGMLAFLLFAGALHVDINDLREQRRIIALLATIGLFLSTALVGLCTRGIAALLGIELPWIHCFLFGALISPTDPIAVLGILKSAGVPKSVEIKITGESLFNDGVAVVVFLMLLEITQGGQEVTAAHVGLLFLRESVGGAALGLATGLLAYVMLKSVDNYQVEVLITLALVSGTYALASSVHMSGPIAVVVAGLLIGNHGRSFAMTDRVREHLDMFWELIDSVLNAILFLLIGLEVLLLDFSTTQLAAGALAIGVVLAARFVSVLLPVRLFERPRPLSPYAIHILTWGGLRGGISVALALGLPHGPERDAILALTYPVVVFSILVQGLSLGWLIRTRWRAPY